MVEDNERNLLDQKLIESELFRKYRIHSMRCNFDCIKVCGKVDPLTQVLTVTGKEIAFVYYRTGYQADHYIDAAGSDHKWEARELLECSMAIKCPSIDFQLTTFKKYQQAFGDAKLLKEVMRQKSTDKIEHLFRGLYSLEDFETNTDT